MNGQTVLPAIQRQPVRHLCVSFRAMETLLILLLAGVAERAVKHLINLST